MAAGKPDYYDILGVNKTSSSEDIKKAYRKQALEWHPDRHKDNKEAAEKRFKEINEAYQVLSDSNKRKTYDQFGHDAFSQGGFSRQGTAGGPFGGGSPFGQTGQWGPFTYSYSSGGPQSGNYDFGDPFDIFEQFFGGASPFRQSRVPRYSISIDFLEAAKGVEKNVEIEGKRKKIKIPPGVDDGTRINFNDFLLSINVKPHEIFERDGADVYMKLDIPYSLATLGGDVKVPTIEKEVKIKVRQGTQSGTMMRLRGMGVKNLRGSGRGDQYVKINVEVPTALTRDQRQLIDQMKKEGL